MLNWYLVHTKPAGEAVAQINLVRQGYEVYLPQLIDEVRSRGRLREKITALFPRYLFIRIFEGQQSLGPVRSSLGVSNVVRFGRDYAIVPDRIVRDLRTREEPGRGLHRLSRPAPLISGTRVRVTQGPFDGLDGIFQRDAGADRVVVLLQLLGQTASVRVPIDFILPAHVA